MFTNNRKNDDFTVEGLRRRQLIKNTLYSEIPVRGEYELTDFALHLVPIWNSLINWSDMHKDLMKPSVFYKNDK
jgi:DNA-binding HxlR family transcriptional regulator